MATTITEKQLGQARPSSAAAPESAYSPGASTVGIVKYITVCNTTDSPADYSIYVDDDGSTYDADSKQFNQQTLEAKETHLIRVYWPMNNASGNLAVESSVGNAINFTIYGAELT